MERNVEAQLPRTPGRRQVLVGGASLLAGSLLGCRAGRPGAPAPPLDLQEPPAPPTKAEPPVEVPAPLDPRIAPTPEDLPGGRWPMPDLSDRRVLGQVAGIRPYRRGSIRLEGVSLHGRPLIHNYGHGGAGITLAPGSALEVLDLLASRAPQAREVAVLGSGVMGLTVASMLVAQGVRVQIYAESFPPNTTSNIAGGQFAPSLVARGRNDREREQHRRLVQRSFDHYTDLIGQGYGVFPRLNYTTFSTGSALNRVPTREGFGRLAFDPLPIHGTQRSGFAFPTLLIEPPVYLSRLQGDLAAQGVPFHEARLEALEELEELPGDAVINCLGLGSAQLFGDNQLVPTRGQLVHVEAQDLPFLLCHSGYLFPRQDLIVLGGSVERGVSSTVPDPGRCADILQRHRQFFPGERNA